MEKNNNIKDRETRNSETQSKLEKMRVALTDEEKCKEIAQKLCAYISSNS